MAKSGKCLPIRFRMPIPWKTQPIADLKKVQVRISNFGLVIHRDPLTTRVPDIAAFLRSQVVEQDGYIHSAPELIVEVLSPANTRTERAEKLNDYESLGVPEVWVVSPEARTVEVLTLENGRLITTALLREGQLVPRHFPDMPVDIAAIWSTR